jgi:hypothetical protein
VRRIIKRDGFENNTHTAFTDFTGNAVAVSDALTD